MDIIDLREHQKECVNNITKHFENDSNNKALIKMFCGAGKSFIIYNSLLKYTVNLSVVVVPSINLITQFIKDYFIDPNKQEYNRINFNNSFELLTVCSKNEIGNNNFTTNADKILDFLEMDNAKIILITYQSLPTLINIIKDNEIEIDLLCFDEAHHILGNNMKELLFGTDDTEDIYIENFIDYYCNKTLFFTATPKNSNNIMMYESVTNYANYELIEDDDSIIKDEPDCGDMIYEYMHYTGVIDNILNDFNIRIDLYTQDTDSNIYEVISRSILETNNNRVLTFHSRSETRSENKSMVLDFVDKKLFITAFDKIKKTEFNHLKEKYKKITFKGITSSTKNKIEILNDFDNTSDNEIYILASCKTIGEGVDTKNANMCVFVDPKQSHSEIIQNIGRICRKNKSNKLSTILIPSFVDVNKYKDCKDEDEQDKVIKNEMSNTGDFSSILSVLSALRQEDPYMFELCLNCPNNYSDKEIRDTVKKSGNILDNKQYNSLELFNEYKLKKYKENDDVYNFQNLSIQLSINIIVIHTDINMEDINIENENFCETINFIKNEDNNYTKVIGNNKINKPNRNTKPTYHINDEIKVLWNITSNVNINKKIFGGYINCTVTVSGTDKWFNKLDRVKKYINENKKKPLITDKNKDIKELGYWISAQHAKYKKKVYVMKNEEIYNSWTKFITEYEKYFLDDETKWFNKLDKVKKYINENNKKPLITDKNTDIKVLGSWISAQLKNYKKKVNIMKNEEIYNPWTKFMTKYKEYFLDNETIWFNKLVKVKKYINENDKRPSEKDKNKDIKELGSWICAQLNNYKKKVNIMKNEEIYNSWTKFMTEYKEYFLDNETIWFNKLVKVKKYINENDKRPSEKDKNKKIKELGSWIGKQLTNYKKKVYVMKNEEIYNSWTKFITEYEKYFLDDETKWFNQLDKVKKYINENEIRPSTIDKNKDIKELGYWISAQHDNYKKKVYVMKNEELYNSWTKFITEYEKYFVDNKTKWFNKLNNVKKYINENDKKPSITDTNTDIKELGSWISHQLENYKKKVGCMTNEEIYNLWTKFITEYEKYFLDDETKWFNKLDKVKKYINENDKKPSTEDKNKENKEIGKWICTQLTQYKKKVYVMKNEEIYNSWTKFITEYEKYFVDEETKWFNKLDKVKKYINENNKRPSRNDKNTDIKELGSWISIQLNKYKKKVHIMNNEEIYNSWTTFITEYEKYFLNNKTISFNDLD